MYPDISRSITGPSIFQHSFLHLVGVENPTETRPMRGMWAGEKSEPTTTRTPAMDAFVNSEHATITTAIQAVVNEGCALMFSMTRDKGAIVITFLDGDKRAKVYVNGVEELQQAMVDLIASVSPASATPPPNSKASRSR